MDARGARGIAGNLTLDEAAALTVESEAPAMIAHHHGLFAFNTLPVADIERNQRSLDFRSDSSRRV